MVLRLKDVYEYECKKNFLPILADLRMHFYGFMLYRCRDHCDVVSFEGA